MQVKTMEDEGDAYRNKGGILGYGKIIKGTLSEAQMKLRVSSIPNKHENIIYRANYNTAFGTSINKGNVSSQKLMTPGPGSYNPLKDQNRAESKKGSGFFASQTKVKTLQRARSHVPGPGQYKTTQFRTQSSQRHSASSSKVSQNTKQPNEKTKTKFDLGSHQLFKNQLQDSLAKPGVGTYNLNPQTKQKRFNKTSVFKSSVQRFNKQLKQTTPSAGLYQILESKTHINSVTSKKQIQRQQSQKQRQKKIISAIKSLDNHNDKQSIGPGAYTPVLATTTKSFKINQNMYDRFGELKPIYQLAKNIQPVNYPEQEMNSNSSAVHKRMLSTFMSTTKKWDIVLKNQMDPGKYNTSKLEGKKSHLVNFGQKWV